MKKYDYGSPGAYFVTICARRGTFPFGRIVGGEMRLSPAGMVAAQCWREIPDHFPHSRLDAFCVMPNHLHGIIWIVRARRAVPLRDGSVVGHQREFGTPVPGSLSAIVRSFKAAVTRRVNRLPGEARPFAWQRNYWEHVVRNETSLLRIRRYIAENPLRWDLDRENPDHTGEDDFDRWLRTEAARLPLGPGSRAQGRRGQSPGQNLEAKPT